MSRKLNLRIVRARGPLRDAMRHRFEVRKVKAAIVAVNQNKLK